MSLKNNNIFNEEITALQILSSLDKYAIEIGVIEGKENKRNKNTKNNEITNAKLMFIHENGSPIKNIPKRPVLQMTIDWAKSGPINELIDKCIEGVLYKNWTEFNIKREIQILANKMEQYSREIIYKNDGRLIPNSKQTAKRKKSGNHPLFETGQLAKSITARVIELN